MKENYNIKSMFLNALGFISLAAGIYFIVVKGIDKIQAVKTKN